MERNKSALIDMPYSGDLVTTTTTTTRAASGDNRDVLVWRPSVCLSRLFSNLIRARSAYST